MALSSHLVPSCQTCISALRQHLLQPFQALAADKPLTMSLLTLRPVEQAQGGRWAGGCL